MRPYCPLKPTMPLKAAGLRVDPAVCEPRATGHIRAATATADPLLEPPGVWSKFQGFRVGAGSRYANSVVCVLPRIMAPASFRRSTAAASYEGTNPANVREQA